MNTVRKVFGEVNKLVEPAVRAGIGSPPPIGSGLVLLETTGRKSGLVRKVPLLTTRVGGNLVVSTIRADSLWLRNIEADSNVAVWICGRRREAVAEVTRRESLSTVTIRLS